MEYQYQWRHYRPVKLLLALPVGLLLIPYFLMVRLTSKVSIQRPENLDSGILFYGTHRDVYLFNVAFSFEGKGAGIWLGYHGVLSYFFFFWQYLCGIPIFHFSFRSKLTPGEQSLQTMERYLDLDFGILTDSGGPYGKVRRSVVRLAGQSHRPLVALRVRCSKTITIWEHKLPLPFTKFDVTYSPPISIGGLELDEARDKAQRTLDAT